MLKKYEIGKVYWGHPCPFETVVVVAKDRTSALNQASSYLNPNHLQTLTIVSETTVIKK
jgi:hypothetical protein